MKKHLRNAGLAIASVFFTNLAMSQAVNVSNTTKAATKAATSATKAVVPAVVRAKT